VGTGTRSSGAFRNGPLRTARNAIGNVVSGGKCFDALIWICGGSQST
jgi:hypothetical protein